MKQTNKQTNISPPPYTFDALFGYFPASRGDPPRSAISLQDIQKERFILIRREAITLKEREEWEITERNKWPRDLLGFKPGIFRCPGKCFYDWATSHGPRWIKNGIRIRLSQSILSTSLTFHLLPPTLHAWFGYFPASRGESPRSSISLQDIQKQRFILINREVTTQELIKEVKTLKEREDWEITERKKCPRDLPGFKPGTFRSLGECSSDWATRHGPLWMEFESDLVNRYFHRREHFTSYRTHSMHGLDNIITENRWPIPLLSQVLPPLLPLGTFQPTCPKHLWRAPQHCPDRLA